MRCAEWWLGLWWRTLYAVAALLVYFCWWLSVDSSVHPLPLKNVEHCALPPTTICRSWSRLQRSSTVERTKEMCTPRRRWMAAQFRQMNTPKGTDAHVGLAALQSKQR